MTIVIKKKASKKEIATILQQFSNKSSKKSLRNVYGIFKIEGDALTIQKNLRDEWD
jgi:hypothetical protein